MRVGYVVAMPLWKATYRLSLPADPKSETARLQGWAVLENFSGQAWHDVELTLLSSRQARDEDGTFYFAGRTADWMRVDGENFAAGPVERILGRFPGVAAVVVYPVPDPRTGDQVMASLELDVGASLDADALGAFLAAQPDLGTKWAPRFVRIVEAIPLTATGKVDRKPLRAERWHTDDPIWWRPDAALSYRRFTDDDAAALAAAFADAGRGGILA